MKSNKNVTALEMPWVNLLPFWYWNQLHQISIRVMSVCESITLSDLHVRRFVIIVLLNVYFCNSLWMFSFQDISVKDSFSMDIASGRSQRKRLQLCPIWLSTLGTQVVAPLKGVIKIYSYKKLTKCIIFISLTIFILFSIRSVRSIRKLYVGVLLRYITYDLI